MIPRDYVITTRRLVMRAYAPGDGDAVWPVVSHPLIYKTTYNIPKDYPRAHVDRWFGWLEKQWLAGEAYEFGLFLHGGGRYAGNCGIIRIEKDTGTIAYMIAPELWGNGYATEAARAAVAFAFDVAGLRRLNGSCLVANPASERVMLSVGFKPEGVARGEVVKDGVAMDVAHLGMLRTDARPQ